MVLVRLLQTIALAATLSLATADVFITTFTSGDCSSGGLDFMIQSGAGLIQTQPFQSFRVRDITNSDQVVVCAQGFSCSTNAFDASAGLQECAVGPNGGTFDKILDQSG